MDFGGNDAENSVSSKSNIGRSQLFVSRICCPREVPIIRDIVEPLEGVKKVSINVTTKTVYVQHDLSAVSVQRIAEALNKEGFGAELRVDGNKVKQSNKPVRTVGHSAVQVKFPLFVKYWNP